MAAQIKAELDEVHGESASSLKIVYFWINEFKSGRTTTKDKARSGHTIEITTSNMVEKIHHMVMEDRGIKVKFKDFLRRFVTMDETWIHHYTSESKE